MPMLDRLDHLHRARAVEGELPFYSIYTAGLAGERFFRALKDEARIMGTRCAGCGTAYVPARLYCERCFGELDENSWFDAGTRGKIHTFTVMHIGLEGAPLEVPRILAFVQMDGSDGGIVQDLGEVNPAQVSIGMQVEAVFRPPEERTGSINDIAFFRPVE
jgi:uncharacterized protein